MQAETWETSKENLQPVKAGRKPDVLLKAPLTPGKSYKADLEGERRRLLDEIGDSQDDPLPAWLRYIKWTQEAYPGGKDPLLKALESATNALAGCKRYYDDPRFLRLWIQYADCLPDPSDIFVFLQDRGIGRDLALLYEAYATFLELKGNFPRADLVYQEGVNRMAKPLDRIKQKYNAFQQRMAKRLQRQAQEQALGMSTASDDAAGRSALRDLRSLAPAAEELLDENGQRIQRRQRAAQPRQQQQPGVTGVRGQPARAAPNPAAAAGLLSGRGLGLPALGASDAGASACAGAAGGDNGGGLGGAFEVCVDDEFQPGNTGPASVAFPPKLQNLAALPTFAAVRKENAAAAGVWTGAGMKQDPSMAPSPCPSKLEVCTDDEFREQEEEEEAAAAAAAAAAARARLQQQQVLRGSGTSCKPLQRSGLGSSSRGLTSAAISMGPAAKAAAPALVLPPPVILAAAAPAPSTSNPPKAGPGSTVSSSNTAALAKSNGSRSSSGVGGGYHESLLLGPDGKEHCFEEARAAAWLRCNSIAAQPQQQQQQQVQQHAKQQQQQQVQKHAKQHQQQQVQQQDPPSRRPSSPLNPTITVSTRAALNAVNAAFSADLTSSVAPPPCVASGATTEQLQRGRRSMGPAAAEPTVTISTRAALASINRMFSSDLTASIAPSPLVARGRMSMAAGRMGGEGVGVEPTMTINTREALNLVNGMFCDEPPAMAGDMTQRLGGRGRRSGAALGLGLYEDTEFITRGDIGAAAARHRSSRRSSVAPAGGLGLYQDTEFITRQMGRPSVPAAGGSGSGGLGLYEDTEFITRAVTGAMPAAGAVGARSSAGDGAPDLGLYEDTEFITHTVAPAAKDSGTGSESGGLGLYQDTEFITSRMPRPEQQPQQQKHAKPLGPRDARGGHLAAGPSSDPDSTLGLQLSKENRLPPLPPPCTEAEPSSTAGSEGAYAGFVGGAEGLASMQSLPASFARRCDSFEVMDSPLALRERLAAQCGGRGSSSTSSPGPSPDKQGPKENAPPLTAACSMAASSHPLAPRSLADPNVRAAALRPLSQERAELLGVHMDSSGSGEDEYEGGSRGGQGRAAAAGRQDREDPGGAAAAAAASLASPSRRALRSLFQEG